MSNWSYAPTVTHIEPAGDGVATELDNGAPYRVWGFVLSYAGTTTTQTAILRSADATITYAEITFNARGSLVVPIPFIADRGLELVSAGSDFANVHLSVYHGNPGT